MCQGQSVGMLVQSEDVDELTDRAGELPRLLEEVGKGGRILTFESKRVAKDGSRVDVSLTISPIKDERGNTIRERGVILASGLMAGGALGGVLGAALRLIPSFHESWIETPFYNNELISQSVSALLFLGICIYVWVVSMGRPKEN